MKSYKHVMLHKDPKSWTIDPSRGRPTDTVPDDHNTIKIFTCTRMKHMSFMDYNLTLQSALLFKTIRHL